MSDTTRASAGSPEAPRWAPGALLALGTTVLLVVVFGFHSTPLYGVETDLLGEMVPAARALRAGRIAAEFFEFKGPGYPLLLAGAGGLLGGDDWLAARLLNVVSAAAGAGLAFLIATRFLGSLAAMFVLAGLYVNTVWLRGGIEAGTDMPAFALSMAATWLAVSARARRGWIGAGLLAGLSYLTRYNAAALVPAALVTLAARHRGPPEELETAEHRPSRGRALALYVSAFAIPVALWAIASRALAGGAIPNHNYLNVAYTIYGRDMTWDGFWSEAAGRFHSLADVVRLDPPRVASVLGQNVGLHWWRDIHELVPIGIGIPALVGMLLVWPGRPDALAVAAHGAFAYLALAVVFYSPRFYLYLVPFYLMGTAALLAHPLRLPWPPRRSTPEGSAGAVRSRSSPRRGGAKRAVPPARPAPPALAWLRGCAAVALLAASGLGTVRAVGRLLHGVPYEVRVAGSALRRIAPHGGRVMARKPHVAYFAGMEYVPMPRAESFRDLFSSARDSRADYLFYSGIEANLREQFMILEDSALVLPGLVQVGRRVLTPEHFYVLYRFTGEPADSDRFEEALLTKSQDFARRHPRDARVQLYAGALLLDAWRAKEAIGYLERADSLGPHDPQTISIKALAYWELGDFARSDRECGRLLDLVPEAPTILMLRGVLRSAEARWPEACACFARASALEPTDPAPLLQLALAQLASGDDASARSTFDRFVVVAPQFGAVRDRSAGAVEAGGAEAAAELIQEIEIASVTNGDLSRLEPPAPAAARGAGRRG